MTEQWQELKETIIELRDNDGTATQQEVCKFLTNLMDIFENQMQEPCETQMIDKSNFSQEQYKADLQSAYDCGKASVKPCEDAISRAELLARSVISVPFHMSDGSVDYVDMVLAADVCRAKSIQLKQETGHWIFIGNSDVNGLKICECDVCGKRTYGSHNFCPNCGAKMVKPWESE